jgi:hypothetical protein
VIDDYAPHQPDSRIRQLYAIENALTELTDARPAYVFYPSKELRALFGGYGWNHEETTDLLRPVPWTQEHMRAHVDAARQAATDMANEIADPLLSRAEQLADEGDDPTSRMYSLVLRYVP